MSCNSIFNFKLYKYISLLRKNVITFIFALFLVFLVIFSNNNLIAAKEGITLWATCVVPSLLPFFIATELLNYTNIAHIIGKLLHPIMKPIFNVPGECAYALIMGFISGYPVGAKIVSDMYSNGLCTKEESERLLSFTNNSGPLFIIGTAGILIFGNTSIGIILLITHILSSLTVGFTLSIISRCKKNASPILIAKKLPSKSQNTLNISDIGNILGTSISNAISTVLLIGGFVVLFSVILSILNRLCILQSISNILTYLNIPYNVSQGLISGLVELTSGISIAGNLHLKNISINIVLCAFLLGFGGLSILLQVLSIVSRHGLSIKTYFYGKLLQGLIAALYTYLFLSTIPILNLDIP